MIFLGEPLHDRCVGSYTMSITPIFERGLENDIGVTMICDHNVLVATARPDRESATVIGVHATDGILPYVDLIGGWQWRGNWRRQRVRRGR